MSKVCSVVGQNVHAVKHSMTGLLELLDRISIDYQEESAAQRQIEEYLTGSGAEFEREYRLDDGIIDFYFPRSKIGLEVKALKSWNKKEVYRQCERYLQSDDLSGLVLATGRAQGMPAEVLGKPVVVYQLSRGSL